MTTYIGIDNGITGGLAAITQDGIKLLPMPVKAKSKGEEVDILKVDAWLMSLGSDLCVIMEQPGGSKSYTAAVSMADSFGALRAMVELRWIRHHRITPQAWQKIMLPNCGKGDTKPFAASIARRLWPELTWMASERSRKPHGGLIDAALIAEYGRRKML